MSRSSDPVVSIVVSASISSRTPVVLGMRAVAWSIGARSSMRAWWAYGAVEMARCTSTTGSGGSTRSNR
jgi:hypothetical protein